MNFIKAYADKNAVKVIAFAINFNQKLSDKNITELISNIKALEYFTTNFSKAEDQTEMSFVFTPDGAQQQTITTGGIVFSHMENDQQIWSVTLNKEVILITCKKYSRWAEISSVAYEHFTALINAVEDTVNMAQVTLEYLDEFEVISPSESWKEELFDPNCNYLNSNIYMLNDFWHLNQGYFIKLDELDNKLLDTININYYADQNDNFKHKVDIRTQHKLLIEPVMSINKLDYIQDIFGKMHKHSKNIFESIIHNDVLDTFK